MELSDLDIKKLEQLMEEMANAPREEMGYRVPGEKCSYEKYSADGRKLIVD